MTAMTKDEMLKLCRSKLRTALVLYCTELHFEHAKEHRQKKKKTHNICVTHKRELSI